MKTTLVCDGRVPQVPMRFDGAGPRQSMDIGDMSMGGGRPGHKQLTVRLYLAYSVSARVWEWGVGGPCVRVGANWGQGGHCERGSGKG